MQIPNITLADIEAEIQKRQHNRIADVFPDTGALRRDLYTKHLEFFASGSQFRVREFRAANRVGKSIAGAYETVCHLTGKYPHWWTGKRFTRPVSVLVAGESGRLVRDSIQLELLGPPSSIGTGMIPFDDIYEKRPKTGIPDAVDTCQIRHVSGGMSILQFQSFDQGREAFQATARDVIWLDEEAPLAVYTEALTRTMTTGGVVYMTFTPLKGMSETVMFLEEQVKQGKVCLVTATWDDAPHLSEKDKEEMLAAYPPHQRDARTKGIPALGSGAIYPVPESEFVINPIDLPIHWRRGYALDVGWNRTAALFFAHDDDTDTTYLYSEHYRGLSEPSVHAEAIKARGEWLHGVIDPASHGRGQSDGNQLFDLYQQLGLHITNAKNGVESGIYDFYQRLSGGRIKVFSTLVNFLNEYRLYRRDEKGRIIKENDHLMDCLHPDTEVITRNGRRRIIELVGTEGEILSINGEWASYKNCQRTHYNHELVRVTFSDGHKLICTPKHKLLCSSGLWITAIDSLYALCHVAVSQRINTNQSCQQLNMDEEFTARNMNVRMDTILAEEVDTCIVWFLRSIFTKFQKGSLSTIRTAISSTTIGEILSLWKQGRTFQCTIPDTIISPVKLLRQLAHGAKHLLARYSGMNSVGQMPTLCMSSGNSYANVVEKSSKHLMWGETGSARIIASRNGAETAEPMTKIVHAISAEEYTKPISTSLRNTVQMSVVRVEFLKERSDVYCMEVPITHAFALTNGVVVHNCGRYIISSGLEIAVMPPAWREKLTGGRPKHVFDYDPLSDKHINGG